MRKIPIILTAFLCLIAIASMAQFVFPVDSSNGRISFSSLEPTGMPCIEFINKAKEWFTQYYRKNSFEDRFGITRKGKPVFLKEDKIAKTIAGKCGFLIRYPKDRSGLNQEGVFISFILELKPTDSTSSLQMTDFVCYSVSGVQNDMRPPEYNMEIYNEPRMNDMDYVQDHVIPQVVKGIRAIREELLRYIRLGPDTGPKLPKIL